MATHLLLTPVPGDLAHSSLGWHAAWQGLGRPDRAWLDPGQASFRAAGSGRSPGQYDALWATVAWELEVPVLAAALRASGVEPRRSRRPPTDPMVVLGGPLALSNPDLGAALADAVFVGEADGAFGDLRRALDQARDRDDALARLAAVPGTWVPALHGPGACPAPVVADPALLPARTVLRDAGNLFGDAFLVEVGRGCPRACTFCVVRGGVRKASFVPADRLLQAVPADARRVGLLGAAVSDHPDLPALVEALRGRGAGVTLGSVRADRVTPELLAPLAASGLRTLTVAADGPSEALRAALRKGVTADHLRRAADLARAHGLSRMRLYAMVGLPGEEDADLDELAALVRDLSGRVRVALSVSPFVPKRFTALASAPFAGVKDLKRRLARLARAVGGAAVLKASSPREAEREYRLSHVRIDEAEGMV